MTQIANELSFSQQLNENPKSSTERDAILANPGFGDFFTDHTAVVDFKVDADGKGGWSNARIEPYGPIAMDPAAGVSSEYRRRQDAAFRPAVGAARVARCHVP